MKSIKSITILSALVFICTFKGHAQCIDNMHAPFYEDGWLSCERSANPNPERPAGHFLLYDFGYEYALDTMYVWNYNTWGLNEYGMKNVIIDYSLDGTTWMHWDTVQFAQATGRVDYNGSKGPSLGNISARYILLTAIDNWAGTNDCVGLSEIKFEIGRPTSINPEPELAEIVLDVFPNPVVHQTTVSFSGVDQLDALRIVDATGRIWNEVDNIDGTTILLDMADLPSGMYLLEAWSDNVVQRTKIVKINP